MFEGIAINQFTYIPCLRITRFNHHRLSQLCYGDSFHEQSWLYDLSQRYHWIQTWNSNDSTKTIPSFIRKNHLWQQNGQHSGPVSLVTLILAVGQSPVLRQLGISLPIGFRVGSWMMGQVRIDISLHGGCSWWKSMIASTSYFYFIFFVWLWRVPRRNLTLIPWGLVI